MLKSHNCGDLRADDDGREVSLAGWVHRRRDHGGLIFIDLRDSHGLVQVVFNPQDEGGTAHAVASEARVEYVLRVQGTVRRRPAGTENASLPTGDIEVAATSAELLNPARTPPFYINEDSEVDELLRLRYRYLDLRRPEMLHRIQLRHRAVAYIREFMNSKGFIEVETPILLKSTPEGARDFLVPSRLSPGEFYALPQSPQQLKQLLMVAGVERYYQIARCFRDEDLRADRQPEFTQLDYEMSFVDEDDVLGIAEELYRGMFRSLAPDSKAPERFPRLSYAEALERFGSDKPDLRYGVEISDFSDLFAGSEFGVFRSALDSGGRIRGLAVPGGAEFSRRQIDELTEVAKTYRAKGLVSIALLGEGPATSLSADDIRSPVARFLPPETVTEMANRTGANRGDLLLAVADRDTVANPALDAVRRDVAGRVSLADPRAFAFAFITDFPLFEWNEDERRWDSSHHPFTAPRPEDLDRLTTEPGSVVSRAYDLVCNGYELGSGSIRIHRREVQEQVFSLLGIGPEEQEERFGGILEAFQYGAPPHGGFAPGIDRTVMLLAGAPNIREVMAFPKTQSGSDPMMGAPSAVEPEQLAQLGLRLVEAPA
jgi:aspartyl-tRNA synthetase